MSSDAKIVSSQLFGADCSNAVIPAKAGIQTVVQFHSVLDPRLRGGDDTSPDSPRTIEKIPKIDALTTAVVELSGTVGEIHRTVVHIESDHGEKLRLLFEHQDAMCDRLERVETKVDNLEVRFDNLEVKFDSLERSVGELKREVREINTTSGLLHSIANDHEVRLRRVETGLEDHLARHGSGG